MFGKRVTNWVVLDKAGKLKAFKWTLPVTAVENVPSGVTSDVRFWMKVPTEFSTQTVFTGMSYDYLPHGHAPAGVYNVPHWENHFITFSQEESVAINCKNPKYPKDNLLPPDPGWFILPPPDNCVAGMGLHAVNAGMPEFNKEDFTKSFVPDYYDGKFASLEAKATSKMLIQRKSFEMIAPNVPAPRASLLPGKIEVTYYRLPDTYVFSMTDFTEARVVAPE
ncbi:hypothetical protein [Pendulispora albinea]|uniref:Uncharacterized protein n=1 Tax=Pendulispora albinea TaxID=2741071 RepID=A0ABZ2M3T9_9BACT